MICCTKTPNCRLSKIVLLVFYMVAIVLTPLFHHHPEGHHPDSINSGYHSHVAPFANHTHEHSEDDQHEDNSADHFGSTMSSFKNMIGVVQVNPDNIFKFSKLPIAFNLVFHTFAENSVEQPSREITFKFLPHQPQQDYCVFAASNLSPPVA